MRIRDQAVVAGASPPPLRSAHLEHRVTPLKEQIMQTTLRYGIQKAAEAPLTSEAVNETVADQINGR